MQRAWEPQTSTARQRVPGAIDSVLTGRSGGADLVAARIAAPGRYNRLIGKLCLVLSCVWLAACGASNRSALEDLNGREDLARFTIGAVRGTRDGDRLRAQAMLSDSSSILTLDMQFAIGSPTTLVSGTWRWTRDNRLLSGTVSARSVTFLGGQSDAPSIGGTFDLLEDGAARYRVRIPVTELKARAIP